MCFRLQERLLGLIDASTADKVATLDAHVVSRAASLWLAVLMYQPSLWPSVPSHPKYGAEFFVRVLLCGSGDGSYAVRLHMAHTIHRLCTAVSGLPEDGDHPVSFFLDTLLARLPSEASLEESKYTSQCVPCGDRLARDVHRQRRC